MFAHINDTIDVVCRYVEEAEEQVQRSVSCSFPEADEEQIITLFQEKLTQLLATASDDGAIAAAFAADLVREGVPRLGGESNRMARGIVAEVSWHPRHVEK